MLAQRRRQTHHPFEAIRAHYARLEVGKVAAGEVGRWRHVLVKDQHVRCKNAGLLVHFAGQRNGQLTDVRRDAIGGDRPGDAGNIQRLSCRREVGDLRF